MSSFVIAGTQRSGTTMLRSALDSHPHVRCLGEVFYINPRYEKRGGQAKGQGLSDGFSSWREHSYQVFRNRSNINRLRHWIDRSSLVREYLDGVLVCDQPEACGFKLMVNQTRRFPEIIRYIAERQVLVIHMVRDNVLDVLVSRLALEARGYAHSSVNVSQDLKVTLPVDDLVAWLDRIQRDNEYWQQSFEGRSPYLRVGYERFVCDRQQASKEILAFIGVDTRQELVTELKKLVTRELSEVIDNYGAVSEVLRGTRYKWCLSGQGG